MSIEHTSPQFIDLGGERSDLESYLTSCKYWEDTKSRGRYAYQLSPSAYVMSPEQQETLGRLARTTYASVQALNARLCEIGLKKSPSNHDEGRLITLANIATRGLLRPSDGVTAIPPVLKVDLVQNAEGGFGIVEIDTYNPRGLGYVALLEGTLAPEYAERRFPGLAGIADILKSGERYAENPQWHVLVSDFERYYENAFRIFARAMESYDVDIRVVRSPELANGSGGMLDRENLIIIPDTLDAHPEVRERLLKQYRNGELNALFPPVAYLGSKAFLPFLRRHPGMEEFIPPTTLVGKKCGDPSKVLNMERPLVLKAAVSSGLKKVIFSDLDECFDSTLARVKTQKNPSWILQEQVPQKSESIVVFDDEGNRVTQDYYLRVTAYIAQTGVVDVEVTGRPDRKVHGAPDCIMLPALFA